MTTSIPVRRDPDTYQGYACETLLLRSRRLAGIEQDLGEYIDWLDRMAQRYPHTSPPWAAGVADELRRILGENDNDETSPNHPGSTQAGLQTLHHG